MTAPGAKKGKGKGKGPSFDPYNDYGKGHGQKGNSKGTFYPGEGGGNIANNTASFLNSLVQSMEANGSSPEAIAQVKVSCETLGINKQKGPIPPISPLAKLKKEVKIAYAKVADLTIYRPGKKT